MDKVTGLHFNLDNLAALAARHETSLLEGFDSYVEAQPSGCHEWQGGCSTAGYGVFRQQYAHRISYERARGSIPEGYEIDHLCKNRACVNPDHLEAVTPAENARRAVATRLENQRRNSA